MLPRTASIGTSGWIIGHLGMNPHATIAMNGQDYLVFDAFTPGVLVRQRRIQGHDEIFDGGGIVVLAKKDRFVVLCHNTLDPAVL
jgi:hypothetical protein